MPTTPGKRRSADLAHPHGWFGYVVADDRRTGNALRLLRWAVAGAVLVTLVAASALAVLAAHAPGTVWLLGGASSAAVGGLALRARRTNRRR